LKEKRNQLHLKSKKLADDRDALNSTIREMRNKIVDHKKKRDELNERVKHAKEQRNTLNKSYSEIKKQIEALEKERLSTAGANLNDLRKQLRTLENEQMTQPMSPQKEKKIIEVISGIHTKIKEQEDRLNSDPKLKKASNEEKIIKQKAEKQHDLVEKLATRAQEEHEGMIELIRQLDNLVKKVNVIQETIVMTKIEADTAHKEFIESVDKIHDLERKVSATQEKKRKIKKAAEVTYAQKEANEIFERFKRGEKLSTEDLMALQKAGLI
ncbi:MAG: hypothetical protein KAH91_05910, partial [Thermoplasmatales archaeon]|nr:hypothetical protein [Thermoplasmatales archaeon]